MVKHIKTRKIRWRLKSYRWLLIDWIRWMCRPMPTCSSTPSAVVPRTCLTLQCHRWVIWICHKSSLIKWNKRRRYSIAKSLSSKTSCPNSNMIKNFKLKKINSWNKRFQKSSSRKWPKALRSFTSSRTPWQAWVARPSIQLNRFPWRSHPWKAPRSTSRLQVPQVLRRVRIIHSIFLMSSEKRW